MRKLVVSVISLFVILSVIGLAYVSAQVNIGEDPTGVSGVVIEQPSLQVFNNNSAAVNSSELWLTDEGIMDNVVDLFPTFINAGFNNTGGNPFDQSLNTTDDVIFNALNSSTNITTGDALKNGDAGTFMQITGNSIFIIAAGTQMFQFDGTSIQKAIIFSLLGLDVDLAWSSVNVQNLLFCDAGADDCTIKDLNAGNLSTSNLMTLERTSQTISSGTITASSSYIILDTEGGAATDDLFTINGGTQGSMLILQTTNNARDVILVDGGAGNLQLSNNYSLLNVRRRITLLFDGFVWVELAESNN